MRKDARLGAIGVAVLVALTMVVAMTPSEVIAAAQTGDQSPTPVPVTTAPNTAGNRFGASDVITLVLAACSLALIFFNRWHRIGRAPKRPIAFSPVSALMLLGAMFLVAPLGSAIAQSVFGIGVPEGESVSSLPIADLAKLMLGATLARGLGVAAYVAVQRMARPPHPDRRWSEVVSIAAGIAVLLLTWPVLLAAVLLAGLLAGAPPDRIAHETLRQLAEGPWSGWTLVIIAIVLIAGPIIEEVMYRGLLQEGMRRAGASCWHAIMLTSVLFAVAHIGIVQPHALIGLFVLSLGLGWCYEKSGSLWAPITMHILFNAGNLLLARSVSGV